MYQLVIKLEAMKVVDVRREPALDRSMRPSSRVSVKNMVSSTTELKHPHTVHTCYIRK